MVQGVNRVEYIDELVEGQQIITQTSAFPMHDGKLLPKNGITLDFSSFPLESISLFRCAEKYLQHKEIFDEWAKIAIVPIDPYLIFAGATMTATIHKLLDYDPKNAEIHDKNYEEKFNEEYPQYPKLSEFKGAALCTPQAALGTVIMQKILPKEYYCAYLGTEIKSKYSEPGKHSCVLVGDLNSLNTFIMESTWPHIEHGTVPRIALTEVPFTKESLNNLPQKFYTATEIFTDEKAEYLFGRK